MYVSYYEMYIKPGSGWVKEETEESFQLQWTVNSTLAILEMSIWDHKDGLW